MKLEQEKREQKIKKEIVRYEYDNYHKIWKRIIEVWENNSTLNMKKRLIS